jgi:hypothetical protein
LTMGGKVKGETFLGLQEGEEGTAGPDAFGG